MTEFRRVRMRGYRLLLAAATALLGLAAGLIGSSAPAMAGEFPINSCQADRLGFSSQAFDTFATRGMKWKRACNPVGPGLRGLVTGNVVRDGRVARGAQSLFVMDAPPGTRFVRFRWSGKLIRRDCRYALQLYADRPDGPPITIRNVRANRKCPRPGRAQASGLPRPRTYDVAGATRIVQRAICVGGTSKRFCSARGMNQIRTFQAQATVVDATGPAVGIVQDTPFTQGAWVRGSHSVSYDANDNVGVKVAHALALGSSEGQHSRVCDYTHRVPCPNGAGQIQVDTRGMSEGTQTLQVVAVDTADNSSGSAPVTVRVDNTPPGAVPLSLEGGDTWRSVNDYDATWQNPAEGDRAPIVAAHWTVCLPTGAQCSSGSGQGEGIARLADLAVPGPGSWELRMWRADSAGNSEAANASPPVTLRYDPEPPQLGFEGSPADDPTKVSVAVSERVSGLAGGQIEISQEGSATWQTVATQLDGNRLVARIDDAGLPAGRYNLRAQATDLAGNVGVTTATQAITLPLRVQSAMEAGVAEQRVVRRKIKRRGKRVTVRRRVTVLQSGARVRFGRHVTIAGRLTNRDGQPLAGQEIRVITATANGDQLLATLATDAQGRYRYRALASHGRTLRFVYLGSGLVLPVERQVTLVVPAAGSFRPSRARLPNGRSTVFRGRVRSGPLPLGGKLVEVQVRQPSGEWTTFRTLRTDANGRWALRYRFRYVRCHTTYRLRARIPAEAGYPFASGRSRVRKVTVRGAEGPCP
jgi:5-hydroxyisourate hydrolase-like protein (transthyretin family)